MTSPNIVVGCPRCTHPKILGITLPSSQKSSAGKKHLSSLKPFSDILLRGSRHPPLVAVQYTLHLLHSFLNFMSSPRPHTIYFSLCLMCLPLVCVWLLGSRNVLLTNSGSTWHWGTQRQQAARMRMLQQFNTRTYSPWMCFPRRCIPWTLLILSKASTAPTRLRWRILSWNAWQSRLQPCVPPWRSTQLCGIGGKTACWAALGGVFCVPQVPEFNPRNPWTDGKREPTPQSCLHTHTHVPCLHAHITKITNKNILSIILPLSTSRKEHMYI